MSAPKFVFPNVVRTRGNFSRRCELARHYGCTFVEIPAHFIRGKKEVEKTHQVPGSIPSRESIQFLYGGLGPNISPLPYILHTEAILPGKTPKSRGKIPELRWADRQWRECFVKMLCDISDVLGCPAAKIEVHPGLRSNVGLRDILTGVSDILETYSKATGNEPEVLLENRTDQRVKNGQDIADIYFLCEQEYPHILDKFGIVLDVSQLYTVTGEAFLSSFAQIPDASLRGFHIHTRHLPSNINDDIPWNSVFERISGLDQDFIINPELLHESGVAGMIGFCKELLKSHQI
ncbi:MAG: hypothetical protein WCP36_02960 [Methanomicrobiales archaeon]